jgi:hypothetical protein
MMKTKFKMQNAKCKIELPSILNFEFFILHFAEPEATR